MTKPTTNELALFILALYAAIVATLHAGAPPIATGAPGHAVDRSISRPSTAEHSAPLTETATPTCATPEGWYPAIASAMSVGCNVVPVKERPAANLNCGDKHDGVYVLVTPGSAKLLAIACDYR